MDHQWQPGLARRCDMDAKTGRLGLPRAEIIVIVEPGFTDADDFRMLGERHQIRAPSRPAPRRHDGDACPPCTRPADSARQSAAPIELPNPRADRHHQTDAGCLGARQNALKIFGKTLIVEMAMAVDDRRRHHAVPFLLDIAREDGCGAGKRISRLQTCPSAR